MFLVVLQLEKQQKLQKKLLVKNGNQLKCKRQFGHMLKHLWKKERVLEKEQLKKLLRN